MYRPSPLEKDKRMRPKNYHALHRPPTFTNKPSSIHTSIGLDAILLVDCEHPYFLVESFSPKP